MKLTKNLYSQLKEEIELYLQIGINEKSEQFEKFLDRTLYLTSDTMWRGTVKTCKQGTYFELCGARSSFSVYVDCHGHVGRKPRNIEFNREFDVWGYGRTLDKIAYY